MGNRAAAGLRQVPRRIDVPRRGGEGHEGKVFGRQMRDQLSKSPVAADTECAGVQPPR